MNPKEILLSSLALLLKNIANLFKVKTIVTLLVMGLFTYNAANGLIDKQSIMYIATSVISFYFGTQVEKDTTPKN